MKKLTFLTAILLAFSTLAQVPNYVPTNGLVGWWPFNGNANDESGNGSNGTVFGATLTNDRLGYANNAYDFDGSNDYIDIVSTNGLNSSSGLSMSMWFNWNGPNGVDNHQYFFLIANNPNGYLTISDAGILGSNVLNCNCVNDQNIQTSIIANTWYNVILTYDLSQGLMKLYLNGVLINTTQENMYNYYTTNNIADRFGNYHFNSHYFNGQLDEAGLWNRPLNLQEVANLYNGVYNLPVELTQFSATCSENTTNINWQTASENNSAYFEVLKSRDGEVWTSKTTTPAAGNSTSTIDYSFTDNNEASLVYYKLKQVDKDGQYKEYGPISANCNESTSLFISPNPTNGEFNLVGMEHFGTITSLEIKDAAGKVVKVLNPTTTNFSCVGLKAGVYFLAVTSNKTERVIKIIKE